MASTNFVDYSTTTPIVANWLNHVNRLAYHVVDFDETPSSGYIQIGGSTFSGGIFLSDNSVALTSNDLTYIYCKFSDIYANGGIGNNTTIYTPATTRRVLHFGRTANIVSTIAPGTGAVTELMHQVVDNAGSYDFTEALSTVNGFRLRMEQSGLSLGYAAAGASVSWVNGITLAPTGVTINTPLSFGNALTVNSSIADWALKVQANTTAGSSYGIQLRAGSNSSDSAFSLLDSGGVTERLRIRGDGLIGINGTPAHTLDITALTGYRALNLIGASGQWTEVINANTTSGAAWGLYIKGGTTSADEALRVENASSTLDFFTIRGDGLITLGQGQLKFPATQNASSDVNVLDDYEEGDFTPVVVGTSTAGAGTYTVQVGKYTKIGDTVHFWLSLGWSAHTGTGNIYISGLPWAANSTTNYFAQCPMYIDGYNLTANTIPLAQIAYTESYVRLYTIPTVGGSFSPAALSLDSAVTSLRVSGSYKI